MTTGLRKLCADLPVQVEIKGQLRLQIEAVSKATVDKAWDIVNTAAESGDGIGTEEVPSRKRLLCPSSDQINLVGIDLEAGNIVGVLLLIASPLSRSSRPIYGAGPFVISPKYRSKKIGFQVIEAFTRQIYHQPDTAYQDYLGRSNLLAAPRLTANRIGDCVNLGIIPNGFYLPQKNIFVDDIITFGDTDPIATKADRRKETEPMLPFLVRRTPLPEPLRSQLQPLPDFRCPEIPFRSGMLRSTLADEEDMWRVEELIRACADRGDGFGLDEFTDHGYFNRALLLESHVIVVKTESGVLTAAVVFGLSSLCRSRESNQVGGYFIVTAAFQSQGLGKALLRASLGTARNFGYNAVLTDVLVTNEKALTLMRKEGFFITATLPNVARVRNVGLTDSHVMWRPLKFSSGERSRTFSSQL